MELYEKMILGNNSSYKDFQYKLIGTDNNYFCINSNKILYFVIQ